MKIDYTISYFKIFFSEQEFRELLNKNREKLITLHNEVLKSEEQRIILVIEDQVILEKKKIVLASTSRPRDRRLVEEERKIILFYQDILFAEFISKL